MIEKLPFTEIHSGGEDMVDRVEFKPVQSYEMQHKINELVDAVNELCSKNVHIDTEVRSQHVIDELDRTRKALDKAVSALKRIDETRSGIKEKLHATNGRTLNAGNGFCWATIDDIHNTLEQITALEQKD